MQWLNMCEEAPGVLFGRETPMFRDTQNKRCHSLLLHILVGQLWPAAGLKMPALHWHWEIP